MPSRREYLSAAAVSVLGISTAEVDGRLFERLYKTVFPDSDSRGEEVSFAVGTPGRGYGNVRTKHTKIQAGYNADGEVKVYDWDDELAIAVDAEQGDLRIGASTAISMDEARELRDILTVAIEAQEEWGIEYRPGRQHYERDEGGQ